MEKNILILIVPIGITSIVNLILNIKSRYDIINIEKSKFALSFLRDKLTDLKKARKSIPDPSPMNMMEITNSDDMIPLFDEAAEGYMLTKDVFEKEIIPYISIEVTKELEIIDEEISNNIDGLNDYYRKNPDRIKSNKTIPKQYNEFIINILVYKYKYIIKVTDIVDYEIKNLTEKIQKMIKI
jgi:hypothetical protein